MSETAPERLRLRLRLTEELFAAAKALPLAARAAFLAERCGDDAALQSEVAALLAIDEGAGGFLEQPADPWIGRRIDRWRVLERIGAGGMGVVYLAARDDGVFEQKAALKLLKHGIDRAELLERFRHERQVLAALSHPNIARLIDGGATDEGIPYFVMEYVSGTQLDQWCDQRRLPLEQRLALFRDVCGAVHYAHQNLVIHRDLKPGNVLVTDDGVVKLVDFGISKVLEPLRTKTATRTLERRLTPEYASPEVVRGGAVTTASDVFSLGVVLYELVTGRRPWQVAEQQSPTDLERAICETTPARPSASAIPAAAAAARGVDERTLRQQLHGDLDAIVMTALSPEPERRYASAQALAADLERRSVHLPIVARAPGAGYLLAKFIRRHRALVAAAIVAALALAAGAAGLVVGTLKARREAASTERVNKLLREMLVQLDPTTSRGFAKSLLNQLHFARDELDHGLLGDDPAIEVELRATLGRIYGALGYAGWASRELQTALALARGVYPDRDPRFVPLLRWVGWAERNCARNEVSVEALAGAIDLARTLDGSEDELCRALLELGLTLTNLGRHDDAGAALRDALARRIALAGEEDEAVAGIKTAIALDLLARGDAAEAEPVARASLALREKLYPEPDPRLPFSLDTLARVLQALGRLEEAEPLLERSLSVRRGLFDPKSPVIGWSLTLLAGVRTAAGRPGEAVPLLEEALAIRRVGYEPGTPVIMQAVLALGLALVDSGERGRALPFLEEAVAIATTQGLADDSGIERARAELAR